MMKFHRALERLLARDSTLFSTERLGWLDAPSRSFPKVPVPADCDRVLWLGMGGSSLAASVYARFGVMGTGLRLNVLDSTAPAAIRAATRTLDAKHTLVVAASKSGTTVETNALLAHFSALVPSEHILVATDAGTPLEARAKIQGWQVVVTDSDIGGRYSALGTGGLLAAHLLGLNLEALREGARDPEIPSEALELAQRLLKHDTVELFAPHLPELALWAEQLLAESSGKLGKGLLPLVVNQSDSSAEMLDPPTLMALGRMFFCWEMAVSIACVELGVNPFDEPDVALAKTRAREALDRTGTDRIALPPILEVDVLRTHLAGPVRYAALLLYAQPTHENQRMLMRAQTALGNYCGQPATSAFGPRYLHSTGQLHKGGPKGGVFLLALLDEGPDLGIPGEKGSFGDLLLAQAYGDGVALSELGQRVLSFSLRPGEFSTLVARLESL